MKTKKIVTIAAIQTAVSEDKKINLKKTLEKVERAAKAGAKIICLQELYRTLYFPQRIAKDYDQYAEDIPGESTKAFSQLARKYGVVIIVPLFERAQDGRYYNSAVVVNEKGKLLEAYRKIHIPEDPGFYEKDYFEEGNTGYKVYKTKFATFSVLICYDQWFPEAARAVRLLGAEIIFYPTALGNIIGYKPEGDWHGAWETTMRSHGIDNSVYICAINRAGVEGRVEFFGQSFISDPFGKVIKRAGAKKEQILIAEIDLERNKFFADGWGFLRNRRPDTYGILTSEKLVKKSKKLAKVEHYEDEQRALEK